MCGRFTQDFTDEHLDSLFELEDAAPHPEIQSRWNGAPTQDFAVCRTDGDGCRVLAVHRWGLVPAWARDPKIGARLINARAETVASKPSFQSAFRRRRCLVPTNGWFEWQRTGAGKQPWWISLGGEPFSFAGMWETWARGGAAISTFTILTCPAAESLGAIHHRQPAIVPRQRYREWLDPRAPLPMLEALVQVPYAGPFACRRVGNAANSARNDYPELLRPVSADGPWELQGKA